MWCNLRVSQNQVWGNANSRIGSVNNCPDFAATVQETMTLGKYQGKSYEDIFAHDPSFCEWTLDFSHPGSQMRHFADWIRERHPDFVAARAQDVMRSGKYMGKSYEDIFAHDPSYCELTLDFSHPGSQMRHFADWIRERHP